MMPSVHSGRLPRLVGVLNAQDERHRARARTTELNERPARALPTWKEPVGDGTKHHRGRVIGSLMRCAPGADGMREEEPASVFLY